MGFIPIVFLFITSFSNAEIALPSSDGCKVRKDLSGACFQVRGPLIAYNGTPTFRIKVIKTGQTFGVVGASLKNQGDDPLAPANLTSLLQRNSKAMLHAEKTVCGEFTVCPFTKRAENVLQPVCIETAKDLAVVDDMRLCSKK